MLLNVLAGIAGCAVLLAVWYRFRRAGARPGIFALAGCAVIIGAILLVSNPARVASLAGVLVAILAVSGLLSCSIVLVRVRKPRYVVPGSLIGRCSHCGNKHEVRRTAQGWLCVSCQTTVTK
jgi:UPF0716 family protein affecting phage T7 exclusion